MTNNNEQRRATDPVGARVAANVRKLRKARGWAIADVHRDLVAINWSISADALLRIEQQKRTVGGGDLVALARVLGAGMHPPLRVADLLAAGPEEEGPDGVPIAEGQSMGPRAYRRLIGDMKDQRDDFKRELEVTLNRLSALIQYAVAEGLPLADVHAVVNSAEAEARSGTASTVGTAHDATVVTSDMESAVEFSAQSAIVGAKLPVWWRTDRHGVPREVLAATPAREVDGVAVWQADELAAMEARMTENDDKIATVRAQIDRIASALETAGLDVSFLIESATVTKEDES